VLTTILFVNKFAAYFKDLFRFNDVNRDAILRQEYLPAQPNYCGLPLMGSHKIDTELVSNVIANLKRGKAIDFDGLSAEHLQYSHPSLCVVLSKLFQLMMLCSIQKVLSVATSSPFRSRKKFIANLASFCQR